MTIHTSRQYFSTDHLPPAQRMEIWKEVFSRHIVQMEIAPIGDAPLYYKSTYQALGSVSIARGAASSILCERPRPVASRVTDDFILLVPVRGSLRVEQRGHDFDVPEGGAVVRRADDPGRTWSACGEYLTLTIPEAEIAALCPDAAGTVMQVIPPGTEPLTLLSDYSRMLLDRPEPGRDELADALRNHITDLASMAMGARGEGLHLARSRGRQAALRARLKAEIERRAADPLLDPATVAAAAGISQGHMRKILAGHGETFSALVLARRLDLARAALADPRRTGQSISEIAYDCGFGDLSYFNRRFRQRFDINPGGYRGSARAPSNDNRRQQDRRRETSTG